jgi:hypothetical protein
MLREAIAGLLGQNVRVVVGRQVDLDTNILEPALDFPAAPNGRTVIEGDITLDVDNRKVPLVWEDLTPDHRSVNVETLSLKAALERIPTLRHDNKRLDYFYVHSKEVLPFAAFLPASAFRDYTFSAIEVLCGKGAKKTTAWQNCSGPDQAALDRMNGRVILIGEDSLSIDQHETVVGTIPGVQLQATYIEALVNGDLFREVPWYVTYIYGFVVFALIEFVSLTLRSLAKAVVIMSIVGGTFLLCYLVVQITGFYLNPGLGVAGAAFAKLAHAAAARLNPRSDV